jgi:glutamate N-acetyltransferase/amino-acid N-acetyltransferase
VANSPLVKTAVAGADPNWGRVVSAAGYAGVAFDPSRFDLYMNDVLIYKRGAPVAIDAASLSADLAARHETVIDLRMNEGQAAIEFWTSDLTAEYVRINADYHT